QLHFDSKTIQQVHRFLTALQRSCAHIADLTQIVQQQHCSLTFKLHQQHFSQIAVRTQGLVLCCLLFGAASIIVVC
ncbi:hypothetical protein Ccrd_024483, partial [Cynara cardunculus var. scolymus]